MSAIGESSVQSYAEVGEFGTKEQEFFKNLDVKLTTCLPVVEMKAC